MIKPRIFPGESIEVIRVLPVQTASNFYCSFFLFPRGRRLLPCSICHLRQDRSEGSRLLHVLRARAILRISRGEDCFPPVPAAVRGTPCGVPAQERKPHNTPRGQEQAREREIIYSLLCLVHSCGTRKKQFFPFFQKNEVIRISSSILHKGRVRFPKVLFRSVLPRRPPCAGRGFPAQVDGGQWPPCARGLFPVPVHGRRP